MNNDRPLTGKFKKWLIQNKSSLPGLRVVKSYIQVVSKVCIAVAGLFLRNVNDFPKLVSHSQLHESLNPEISCVS